jgi:hypothetical protein
LLSAPSTPQRLRQRFAATRHNEEFHNLRIDRDRESLKHYHRWIFETALKSAHVGSIDVSVHGESFLRETASNP